jgi:hypothetical protein
VTNISPALAVAPKGVRDALTGAVGPKFNSYFTFTRANERAVQIGTAPDGRAIFTYSDASMVSDIMVLLSLFSETYESFKAATADFPACNAAMSAFFAADAPLTGEIRRLVEEGEYWESPPPGVRALQRVPLAAAVPGRLPDICRLLRNGSAHFHWRYENLSAQDYWTRQGWDTSAPQPAFGLAARRAENYKAYVVDARQPWDSAAFWDMRDLRILVTPFTMLRYHLHRFFNLLLNGSPHDVFAADSPR